MTHSPRQTKCVTFPRRAALLLTGCAAEITRDAAHGGPTVQRLADTPPPASLSPEERQRLRALDEQVMREQDAAQERRLREAQARAREAYWAHYGWGWNYWG